MALNSVILQGRLTRDPELRYTTTGKAVASFALAVDRDKKENGTDFVNCVAWSAAGEFVSKYFQKGSAMLIKGRLQVRSYEDKNGSKRTATEVIAEHIYFGGSKKESSESVEETPAEGLPFQTTCEDEDLPF